LAIFCSRKVKFSLGAAVEAVSCMARVTGAKPTASTRTVNAPDLGSVVENPPSLSVVVAVGIVEVAANSTCAPATGRPPGSSTVPEM